MEFSSFEETDFNNHSSSMWKLQQTNMPAYDVLLQPKILGGVSAL